MSLKKIEIVKDTIVLELVEPEIVFDNSQRIRDEFTEILDTEIKNIVFSLDKLDFIDSSGLGLLISIIKNLRKRGGKLYICQLKRPILEIFNISNLLEVFNIEDSIELALNKIENS